MNPDDESTVSRRQSREKLRSKKRLRIILISAGALVLALLLAVGGYLLSLSLSFGSAQKIESAFPDEANRPTVKLVEGEAPPINILLLGSDSRAAAGDPLASIDGSRSDSMMLVHVPSDRENIQVVSFMRDAWVPIPGHGENKMNAATAFGGIPLIVQTLEELTAVRIDHVAVVNFDGFKGVTDAVGGVTLNNPTGFYPRHLSGHYFEEGEIALNGEQALAFVRERYSFSDGDYTRVRNQQLFIKALMGKVLSAETLTNPVTIHNLVGAVAPYVAVDEGLDAGRVAGLGFELRDVRVGDVSFMTIPTTGTGRVGNQSVVFVNWDAFGQLTAALQADELDAYTPPPSPYDD